MINNKGICLREKEPLQFNYVTCSYEQVCFITNVDTCSGEQVL